MWLAILSDQLSIVAMVGRYPAIKLIERGPILRQRAFPLSGVSGISVRFQTLFRTKGYVPTCYSPVCHSPCGAFDLHVLSLPPAFVLSQDQTLKL